MYCLFHHISGHFPRQIWFWKISKKTWASVRPPPLLGRFPNFFQKRILKAPLMQVNTTQASQCCYALKCKSCNMSQRTHLSDNYRLEPKCKKTLLSATLSNRKHICNSFCHINQTNWLLANTLIGLTNCEIEEKPKETFQPRKEADFHPSVQMTKSRKSQGILWHIWGNGE